MLSDRVASANPEDRTLLQTIVGLSFGARDQAQTLLKDLRSRRSLWKALLGVEIYADLKEELEEISEDLRWSKSSKGKLVLAANTFAEIVCIQLRNHGKFNSVFIGAHPNEMQIMVTGKVEDASVYRDLIALLHGFPAPYPVSERVTISKATTKLTTSGEPRRSGGNTPPAPQSR